MIPFESLLEMFINYVYTVMPLKYLQINYWYNDETNKYLYLIDLN